jgi:hypothetical protein
MLKRVVRHLLTIGVSKDKPAQHKEEHNTALTAKVESLANDV